MLVVRQKKTADDECGWASGGFDHQVGSDQDSTLSDWVLSVYPLVGTRWARTNASVIASVIWTRPRPSG